MKKKVLLLLLLLLSVVIIALVASYFLLWGNSVYAKKAFSLTIDFEGERYLHALYLGEANGNHYFTMMTANETDNQKRTTHLIGMSSQASLLFHTTIEDGRTFSARMMSERIYITAIEAIGEEAIPITQIYDLAGNLVDSMPAPKGAAEYFMLDDEVFVVRHDAVHNYSFDSTIWSLDQQKAIHLGSGGMVRNVHTLPDGTAIVFYNAGHYGNDEIFHDLGLVIYRISRETVLWEIAVPEVWYYGAGSSPHAVIGKNIVFGTIGHGEMNGPAYIVDFDGNLTEADGFVQGVQSFNDDYFYQQRAYFSDDDCIEILLLHFKRVRRGENDDDRYRDFLLRLDQNGGFLSRKHLKFSDGRNILWISRDGEGNKRYFAVHPNEGSADFEIFIETISL